MKSTLKLDSATNTLQTLEDNLRSLRGFTAMLDLSLHEDDGGILRSHAFGVSRLLDRQIDELEDIQDALHEQLTTLKSQVLEDDRIRQMLTAAGIDPSGADVVQNYLMGYFSRLETDQRVGRIARHIGVEEKLVNLVLSLALNPDLIKDRPIDEAPRVAAIRRTLLNHIGSEDIDRVAEKFGLDADTVYNVAISLAFPDLDEGDTDEPATSAERETSNETRREFIADKLKDDVDVGEIAQALNLKKATVERVIAQLAAVTIGEHHIRQATNG